MRTATENQRRAGHPLGGEFRAHFDTSGWDGTGRVEICEPPQRLLVMTKHVKHPDEHAVEATLTSDGDHTILVLEESGMPLDQLAAYGAGIQIHIEDFADHIVGNEPRETGAQQRWEDLLPAYQDLAASISS
jgi:Activator of Hsp90 ATPase homolog 1-like protein